MILKRILFALLSILLFSFMLKCSNDETKTANIKELDYPSGLRIIKRSDWGWKPLLKIKDEAELKKITIHHGGVEFGRDKDSKEAIRNLQKWSREEKDWIDIPYHFMIDLEGNIFEARPINYPGDTNTEYDPTGHVLVEVMGNYEVQLLSQDQLNSLIEIITFLSLEFNIPLSEIKTHKDYSSITVCPGKDIYKYFSDSTIYREVNKRIMESKN